MNELAKLEALATRTGLLQWDGDDDRARANVAKFTRQAAYELREQGFGTIRDVGAESGDGLVIDAIINRNNGEVFKVVASAASPEQRVQFARVDNLDVEDFVAPEDQFPQQPEESDSPEADTPATSEKAPRKQKPRHGAARPGKHGRR